MANSIINIALITSEKDCYRWILQQLRESGGGWWSGEWISSYQDGMVALTEDNFDIYLIDSNLNHQSGLDLLREARSSGKLKPIVVLSMTNEPDLDLAATKLGASNFLVYEEVNSVLLERSIRYAVSSYKRLQSLHESLRHSEDLFHHFMDHSPAAVSIKDSEGRYIYANGLFEQDLNRGQEVHWKTDQDLWSSNEASRLVAHDKNVIKSRKASKRMMELPHRRGSKHWMMLKFPIQDGEQGLLGCVALDLTEQQQAQAALRESESRYALAARGASDGLWDWNLLLGEVYYSDRWKEMLGYEPIEVSQNPDEWFHRIHPDDQEAVNSAIVQHLEGLSPQFEIEFRMSHRDGDFSWFLCRGLCVKDNLGNAVRMAGSLTDINHRKQVEEQLHRGAFYDSLTGLANRALFLDRLESAIKRGKRREDEQFAVLFLDLDRFKNVNDGLGHAVGDQLLIAFAHRLQECVREQDTVARLGGDEFAILLEDIEGVGDATLVAHRIQEVLTRPFVLSDNQELYTATSIGITTSVTSHDTPKNFLRDADTAMYQAKNAGRNCFAIFDKEMHLNAYRRMQLEMELRSAVERDELELYYQPIINLEGGDLAGFEALMRWRKGGKELISPGHFLSVAEETGLIIPMGWWVMEEGCHKFKKWCDEHPNFSNILMSINLSSRQFEQQDMVQTIDEILERTQVDPARIKLELTESMIMGDIATVRSQLRQLKERNFVISIDDFGTGYSSLGYLHTFPIDILKIDRSFVMRMEEEQDKREIVKTIITLAHRLNMKVIAEGIENQKHLIMLRELNCEYGQGYFFSRPVDFKRAEQMLYEQRVW